MCDVVVCNSIGWFLVSQRLTLFWYVICRWRHAANSDYRNTRIGNKYFLGFVVAEPTRHTVDAAFGGITRKAVVGEFRIVVPTGEVMQMSTFNPTMVGTPENLDLNDEDSFRLHVCIPKNEFLYGKHALQDAMNCISMV